MRFVLLLFLLVSFSIFSQEKRLALVIGNANYTKGALQNPVNDALLMKRTLEELDFDVILDTNITTLAAFNETVRKFGEKRDEYNVGFIYYAGHGIQLNDINYLLATKEEYKTEFDVEDKALSVQKIMRYLTSRTDEVNVLILDACRDNPFEQNWNPAARSTEGGRGLARLSPPTGSLIAYSTDAGNTAADGKGSNSVYCLSLTKNMVVESITLDQVFRNVRADVLNVSSGRQRPVEASQLTGEAFYLKKGKFTDQIIEIDSLIDANNYALALEKTTRILVLSPQNKDALLRKGQIQYNTIGKKYDGTDLFKARELYPKDPDVHIFIARYYAIIGEGEKGISEIERALKLDSTNSEAFYWMARISFEDLDQGDKSMEAISTAIRLSPMNALYYSYRGNILRDKLKLFDQALTDFSKAIELDPTDVDYYYQRGVLYDDYLNQDEKALKDYQKTLEIDPADVDAINAIGLIYQDQGKLDLAIAQYEKGIALEKSNPLAAAFCYSNRAVVYAKQGRVDEALKDYSIAIELDKKNGDRYYNRAKFYIDYLEDFSNALIDLSKAIEMDPTDIDYYYERGLLYDDNLNQYEKALIDYQKIVEIDPAVVNAINAIGLIYEKQGKPDRAIVQYEKGIALEKTSPVAAAFCYNNRAVIFADQGRLEEALKDYSKAIELNPKNGDRYYNRAKFYIDYLEDINNALIDYSKAIQLDPMDIDYYFARGVLFDDYLNQDEKALTDYQKILEIDPADVDAINAIGLIYEDQGKLDLAIAQYEKGIALEKTSPFAAALCYNNRAVIFADQGRLEEALKDYSKAIELNPKNGDRYYNRANFFVDFLGDFSNALIDYSKAIELNPKNSDFYYARGILFYRDLNQQDKAIIDFETNLELKPLDLDAINVIGVIYEEQGNLDLAIAQYEKGIALEKTSPVAAAFCYTNRAAIFADQGRLEEALKDYSKAIELDSKNGARYYTRANFYIDYLEDFSNALSDYSKAIQLDPMDIDYYYARGLLYSDYLNQEKKAIQDFEKILEINPEFVDAINTIGLIYEDQGKLDLAIAQYEKGISLEKNSPAAAALCYTNRANVYANQGNLEEALEDHSKAIQLDPKNGGRYYLRGDFYATHMNNYNKALLDYSMAIQLDPDNVDFLYDRALLYKNSLLDFDAVIEDAREILRIDSTNILGHYLCASAYIEMDMLDSAYAYLDKGIKIDTKDIDTKVYLYRNRANISASKGHFEKALADFKMALELDPQNTETLISRADFYDDYLNDQQKAIHEYSAAIEIEPDNDISYYYRSLLYKKISDTKAQLKDINKAIKIAPDDPEYYLERGIFYTIQGAYEKAEADFNKAYTLDTTNHNINFYWFKYYFGRDDIVNALNAIKKAIKIDPNDPEIYFNLGKIFEKQEKSLHAAKNYSKTIGLLGKGDYYLTDDNAVIIEDTDIYYKIGQFYEKINEFELMCEEYEKALELLENDYRFRYVEMKKTLHQKIELCKDEK